MNYRIKKKLRKRLNFFHYRDYKKYIKYGWYENSWAWADKVSPKVYESTRPAIYPLIGGSWNYGSYARIPMPVTRDPHITEKALYGGSIW